MDKTLTIDLQQEEEQYVLYLTGRLDTLGARELDEAIRRLPEQSPLLLTLDMEQVSFLSSAGIRILIKYYKQCRENQGDFTLSRVPSQAAGVLKMVGLEQLILNGDKPATGTFQECERKNLTFRYQKLHREMAQLICCDRPSDTPLSLHPYDFLIGRSREQKEFIALGPTVASEQASDPLVPLYTLGVHGLPSHYLSFEAKENRTVGFSELLTHLLQLCEAECAGIILLTKSQGITGITFQNAQPQFTRLPVYPDHAVLIAGIACLKSDSALDAYTRPLSTFGTLSGHFHATVYSTPPHFGEETDFSKALQNFTGNARILKTFHLLNDNRPFTGNGENRFSKGHAWIIKNK